MHGISPRPIQQQPQGEGNSDHVKLPPERRFPVRLSDYGRDSESARFDCDRVMAHNATGPPRLRRGIHRRNHALTGDADVMRPIAMPRYLSARKRLPKSGRLS